MSEENNRADAPLSLIPHLVARDERAVSTALLEMCDALVKWREEAQKYREITSHDQSAFSDGYEAGIAAILTARALLTAGEHFMGAAARKQFDELVGENAELRDKLAAHASVRAYPEELTDDLRHVLGFPNFRCGPYAHLMRAVGADIAEKAEDEQAHVLHWLVKMVIDNGERWADVAGDELEAMRAKLAARAGDAS
ncbi:hypothetical protein [Burkholderia ambifaria]|uniref:hypothetical protein n=1 Tax=Burkholderia ambifaria TaxID=152480 RepID=UPI00158C7485|nr:hypothetical protein [Burkholderia ambifaria]